MSFDERSPNAAVVEYPKSPDEPMENVRFYADYYLEGIRKHRGNLPDLVNTYGATMEKRWMMKYRNARRRAEIINSAYPHLHTNPRPAAEMKIGSGCDVSARAWACLYPPLNSGDLVKDDLLLQLIYSYITSDLPAFVNTIMEYTSVDFTDHREPEDNELYRMNVRDAHAYGTILDLQDADELYDLEPNVGLAVLGVQCNMLNVLEAIAKEILKVDREKLQHTGPFREVPARMTDRWPSLKAVSTCAPYVAASTIPSESSRPSSIG